MCACMYVLNNNKERENNMQKIPIKQKELATKTAVKPARQSATSFPKKKK